MGDIANMTDNDGRVNGFRLLRWLRSRAQIEEERSRPDSKGLPSQPRGWHAGRADLMTEMADDLEREIAPPDYPDDDDEDVGPDDKDTGPCEDCGRLADLVLVSGNGRAWLACPACAARAEDDTVDLDDPAFLGRPEQE